MITNLRKYTLHPGKLPAYIELYAAEGWPLQLEHLKRCDGFYVVDIGVQNSVVHLWTHADMAEREQCRTRMQADNRWNSFREKIRGFFLDQEDQILRAAPFFTGEGRRPGPDDIVDLRTYTFHHGCMGEFIELYESEGKAIQEKHWGKPIGFYFSDIGGLNRLVHMWVYSGYDDRAKRRAALLSDPAWQSYMPKVLPLFVKMENTTLRPAPFWR